MKLTTEQIERILNEAPDGWTHLTSDVRYLMIHGYCVHVFNDFGMWSVPISNAEDLFITKEILSAESLREILALRKEVERLRGKLGEVSKVLGGAHSAAEWPTSYCISEIEESLNIDGFLKGEVK